MCRPSPASRRSLPTRRPRLNDQRGGGMRPMFGTRSQGWFCRSLIPWRCRYRRLVSIRGWSSLGSTTRGSWRRQRPAVAGWFTRGAAPGALGPAVIAGHVTWNGPAVFYRLNTLRQGDQVTVSPRGWKDCGLHGQPGGPFFAVAIPYPGGVRPHRSCWAAADHVRWHLRHSQTQISGQRRCVRPAYGGARAGWLITGARSAT